MLNFVHLNVHTNYSKSDSVVKIPDLVQRAKELGMSHLAITDTGTMSGVPAFYRCCKENSINPIIGLTVPVLPQNLPNALNQKTFRIPRIILLAKNKTGYTNLVKLSSLLYLQEERDANPNFDSSNRFTRRQFIHEERLCDLAEGLICINGFDAVISSYLGTWEKEKVSNSAGFYKEVFGENSFYIGMEGLGVDWLKIANLYLQEISDQLLIPIVAINDVHYLTKEDSIILQYYGCINRRLKREEYTNFHVAIPEFWLKSAYEMCSAFNDCPSAIENTIRIAEQCETEVGFLPIPEFPTSNSKSQEEYLRTLVRNLTDERYRITDEVTIRITYEIDIIITNSLSSYFLMLWDIVNHARSKRIPVGPGRGTISSSVVAYVLKITDIDPLKYNLQFEIFYNPEIGGVPRTALDLSMDHRQEIEEYVLEKYGKQKVCHIVSFNKLDANELHQELNGLFNLQKQKQKTAEEFSRIHEKLDRLIQSAEVHPNALVLSRDDVSNNVPISKDHSSGMIMTQYSAGELMDNGFVVLYLLGLSILDQLQLIEKEVQKTEPSFTLKSIPLDDKKTFSLFAEGNARGVFQFESTEVQECLKRVKPTSIKELAILVALCRPGQEEQLQEYISLKTGKQTPTYLIPELELILGETLGLIVYTEQVNSIIRIFTGSSMARADKLRRDLFGSSDKIINGAVENGFCRQIVERAVKWLVSHNTVPLCKAHSIAYTKIGYITAFLKANYPEEFGKIFLE